MDALDGGVALVTGGGAGIGAGSVRRTGDPNDDIAPVAVFLVCEGSRHLTGNTLFVDGGTHINGAAWTPDLDGPGR